MKRIGFLFVALTVSLTLAGCTLGMDTDTMRKLAEARETCDELGGRFEQWATDFGPNWRCDFGGPNDD